MDDDPDVRSRIVPSPEVRSFWVTFVRESNGEVTDFLRVVAIEGRREVSLLVESYIDGACALTPGGNVYLPAGSFDYSTQPNPHPWAFRSPLLEVVNHPAFREDEWLGVLQRCAYRVSRKDPNGEYFDYNFKYPDAPVCWMEWGPYHLPPDWNGPFNPADWRRCDEPGRNFVYNRRYHMTFEVMANSQEAWLMDIDEGWPEPDRPVWEQMAYEAIAFDRLNWQRRPDTDSRRGYDIVY